LTSYMEFNCLKLYAKNKSLEVKKQKDLF